MIAPLAPSGDRGWHRRGQGAIARGGSGPGRLERGAAPRSRTAQNHLAQVSALPRENPVRQPAEKEGAFGVSFLIDSISLLSSQLLALKRNFQDPQTSAYCRSHSDN